MDKEIKDLGGAIEELTEIADTLRLKSVHDNTMDDLFEMAERITEITDMLETLDELVDEPIEW
jgi:hypothetical protein